jgi:chorismate dehydratase
MIRVGTVRYLNAAPLVSELAPPRFHVVADHPRGIAAALSNGEVDVALAPVAAVLMDPTLRIVPGLCVGADGPVASVLLVAETPPEAWSEVVLDGESRTSATLAQLLLRGPLADQVAPDVGIRTVAPGAAPALAVGSVAALVIGDAARALPDRLTYRVDLAATWKTWTGLPFVFAVWACREGFDPNEASAVIAAGRAGVAKIPSRHVGADLEYLTANIRYPLDERALMGLRRYAALAAEAGILPHPHVPLLPPRRSRPAAPRDVEALIAAAAVAAPSDPLHRARLAEHATDAELRLAAQLRRAAILPATQATWLAGRARSGDATPDVAGAGAAFVRVGACDAPEATRRAQEITAAGDVAFGWEPEGEPQAAALTPLLASGLRGVTLDAASLPDDHTWDRLARSGLAVEVALGLPHHHDVDALLLALAERVHAGRPLVGLTLHQPLPAGSHVEPGRPTPAQWLRRVSLARVVLPDSAHISASPSTQGADLAQLALSCGADDLGEIGTDPPAFDARAARFSCDVAEAERLLRVAGFMPSRRDPAYHFVGGAITRHRTIRRPEERAAP